MTKKQENYLRAILSLFSMVFLLYSGTTLLKRVKIDFTEERLYALSDGTKSILAKLDSPIKLKLYYSKTAAQKGTEGLRVFNNHFTYIRELLRDYVANSRNNIELEVIDPRPDTPEEEDALAYGLRKFHLTETETYFFGIVAENESGTEKIIEFFDPAQKGNTEYELTKLIYSALNPKKKIIGVLSSLDVINEEVSPYVAQIMRMQGKSVQDSWLVTNLAREFHEVKKIALDSEQISGTDVLVVIHPKGFSERLNYAIDQYLLGGGKLLVFVDPAAISDPSVATAGGVSSSPDPGFAKLMEKWGIELKPKTFAGDKHLSASGRFDPNQPPGRLLAIMRCNQACTQGNDSPITGGLNNLTMVFPGALVKKDVEGIKHSALLATTDRGNSYTASGFQLNRPQILWRKFSEGTEPVVMAYKSVGKFKTAYPDGIPPDGKKEKKGKKAKAAKAQKKKAEHLMESKKESAVVIVADVDIINDQFAFKRSFLGPAIANQNSTLFLNAVEALIGSVDLLSVRTKGMVSRPFNAITAIELEAEKGTKDKVREINASIAKVQAELSQLGRKANEGNIAILQNVGLKKKKQLAKQIAGLKRELREVKRSGRERIEGIGKFFQLLNTVFIPIIVIILGIWYSNRRKWRMSQFGAPQEEKPVENKVLKSVGGEV